MDKSYTLLAEKLRNNSGRCLWFIDESGESALPLLAPLKSQIIVLTNRYNVWQAAKKLNINCEFNDLDFDVFETEQFDTACLRVSKEKAIVHHAINQLFGRIKPQGTLYLSGAKSEGIKTYVDKSAKLFGDKVKAVKNGEIYVAEIQLKNARSSEFLDDSSYKEIRVIDRLDDQPIVSKPGVFGWNKIDQGSQILVEEFIYYYHEKDRTYQNCLDLGCGYGFLTLATHKLPLSTRTATDSNAAAILCMQENAKNYQLDVNVIADDCGSNINGQFDLILCNPPFHQGFDINNTLGKRFIEQSHKLLAQGGDAFFVVNSFIAIETLAKPYFTQIETLANNKKFKVVRLSR